MISQRAIDLIIEAEVSSRTYYEKRYRHPEWPGGASGVTIGIGYDLGYASLDKERSDWEPHCDEAELRVMDTCLGVHGDPARVLLDKVKGRIDISWDAAMAVFINRDVPEWTKRVIDTIPGADKLSPDCLGVLVSIAYNRGTSWNTTPAGDPSGRYKEMRAIKAHIVSGDLKAVPADIRSMERLWPNASGLRSRRDAEAALFEKGLTQSAPVPIKPVATETPTRTLPPPKAGSTEHGTAITAGAATAAAAHKGHVDIAIAAGVVIAVIVIVWLIVRAHRKAQPVIAREKDHPVQA